MDLKNRKRKEKKRKSCKKAERIKEEPESEEVEHPSGVEAVGEAGHPAPRIQRRIVAPYIAMGASIVISGRLNHG